MVVYFLTKQQDVCIRIASLLQEKGHVVAIFDDPQKFYLSVRQNGSKKIDLLACDCRVFEIDSFDPYKLMKEHDCYIPFIFYNDPYPESEERAVFWFQKNKKKFGSILPSENSEDVFRLLQEMQDIINSAQILPFVSCICPPKSLSDALDASGEKFSLEELKEKYHIQETKFQVLEYFYMHRNEKLSVEHICEALYKECTPAKINTLYSYISTLRSALRQEEKFCIKIERVSKGVYRFSVYPAGQNQLYAESVKDFFARHKYGSTQFNTVDDSYLKKYNRIAPLDETDL